MGKKKIQRKRQQNKSVVAAESPFSTKEIDSLVSSLEGLTVGSFEGAAQDKHGDLHRSECALCLGSLPPFWDQGKGRYWYHCCGKACCLDCRDKITEHTRKAHSERVSQVMEQVMQQPVTILSGDMADYLDDDMSRNYRICPFCRTPNITKLGYYTVEIKRALSRNALQHEYPWAQFWLGKLHLGDEHSPRPNNSLLEDPRQRSAKLGVELCHKAAQQGNPMGLAELAFAFRDGKHGLPVLPELSCHIMTLALEQGHGQAGVVLSQEYQRRGDHTKALEYAMRSSECGCGPASFMVGDLYYNPSPSRDHLLEVAVEKDLSKAFFYFDRGSKQGDDTCQFFAAVLCKELNLPEAQEIEYLKKAAQQGHQIAQHHLGVRYVRHGNEWIHAENWVEGVHLFRRALAGGNHESADNLAHIEKTTECVCFHCGVMAKTRGLKKFNRCAKCQAVYYCSAKCQKAAWKAGHKDKCVKF